ncbi:MAG TPA: histidinol-phosphate transaminase [Planctomycetaceae bacterium]|nr:histidinol-phosphate transaminase [Planctomycetaceae bacterium]
MGLFRPNIDRIEGYIPGEQPQETGWIKLNTNENPYPPSPRVVEALVAAARGRLNVYPDPVATQFRKAAAPIFGVDPDWILPANGSDENLTLILRSFVDSHELVAYPYPSYILYETLADIQGSRHQRLLLRPDWSWDLDAARAVTSQAKLVLIPNPNSPSGNRWSDDEILSLVPPQGILVLDEAYGDFADQPHRGELLRRPGAERIIITRSFSKSFSLAGLRLGFAIARPELISGMIKVKDSYNCDTLSLAGGLAAISDLPAMEHNVAAVRQTRARLSAGLTQLGFDVVPSQANFVWCTHPTGRHKEIYEALKSRKILVRFMRFPDVPYAPGGLLNGLRITVGTDPEISTLLHELKTIV